MTRKILIIVLACLGFGVALNSAGAVLLWHSQHEQVKSNCGSINRVISAGERILNTPKNLKRAYDKGNITRAQYEKSLEQILLFDPLRKQNVQDWREARCRVE